MSPVDYFWQRANLAALKDFLIKKLYNLKPGTKEYNDTVFKLALVEEQDNQK